MFGSFGFGAAPFGGATTPSVIVEFLPAPIRGVKVCLVMQVSPRVQLREVPVRRQIRGVLN